MRARVAKSILACCKALAAKAWRKMWVGRHVAAVQVDDFADAQTGVVRGVAWHGASGGGANGDGIRCGARWTATTPTLS